MEMTEVCHAMNIWLCTLSMLYEWTVPSDTVILMLEFYREQKYTQQSSGF